MFPERRDSSRPGDPRVRSPGPRSTVASSSCVSPGGSCRDDPYAGELDLRASPHRVRDLSDRVHARDQLFQPLARSIARYFHLIRDLARNRWVSAELPVDHDANRRQTDAAGARLSEQVVRHAPTDRQVQELTTVKTQTSTPAVRGTVHDQRIRPGAADGRGLADNISKLDLEAHDSIIYETDQIGQSGKRIRRERATAMHRQNCLSPRVASERDAGVRSGFVWRLVVAGEDLGELARGIGALGGSLGSVAVQDGGLEVADLLLLVAVCRPRLKLGQELCA